MPEQIALRFLRSRRAVIVAGLVLSAIVLGGGGSPAPMTELALQLCTVVAVLAWLFVPEAADLRTSRAIWALVALALAIPLLQLVPLPPSLWRELPGRESSAAALDLIEKGESWMPLTLVRPATIAGLLALVVPLTVMVMTAKLSPSSRILVIAAIAVGGAASVLIGPGQIAGGGTTLRLYEKSSLGWITGFQASRALAADVLLIGLLAFAALCATGALGRYARMWLAIAAAVTALAVVLTGSRVGVAFLVPVMLMAAWIASGVTGLGAKRLAMLAGAGLAALAAGFAVMTQVPALSKVLGRFSGDGDGRAAIWRDGWDAAMAYWPVGGGLGGFKYLFLPYEALESVDETMPNRAHNEVLEIIIESGALGLAALIAGVAIIGWLVVRAWTGRAIPAEQRLFSIGCLGIIAAHSMVDYPLRSMSTACLFAVAIGLLAPPRAAGDATKGLDA